MQAHELMHTITDSLVAFSATTVISEADPVGSRPDNDTLVKLEAQSEDSSKDSETSIALCSPTFSLSVSTKLPCPEEGFDSVHCSKRLLAYRWEKSSSF